MADDRKQDPGLSPHPLVQKLNPAGDVPKGVIPLIGFIGPSRKEGNIRVYCDLQFRSYYELPAKAVLHTVPVDKDDADSPTKVIVAADTPVDIVEITTHQTEAGYVGGSIAQGRLGYTTPPHALPGPICTTMYSCPTAPCHQTITVACTGPTTIVTCPPLCTTAFSCPTGPCHTGGITAAAVGTQTACTGVTTIVTCPPAGTHCTGVTTVVTCPPPHAAAAAPQPLCITLATHYPSWCPPPLCLTYVTAVPTSCGPYHA